MNRRRYLQTAASSIFLPTISLSSIDRDREQEYVAICPSCRQSGLWMGSDIAQPSDNLIDIYADQRRLDDWKYYCTVDGRYYNSVLQPEPAEKYDINPDFVYFIHDQ